KQHADDLEDQSESLSESARRRGRVSHCSPAYPTALGATNSLPAPRFCAIDNSERGHLMKLSWCVALLAACGVASPAIAADSNSLAGIHWWGYYDYNVI